ncbi:HD-GYP domain-containing protein [Pseudomonas sp. LRF_L74]|uniref:HD-GYP domain-containing protein n=1 Tax=Pseudomonas sp. LRF_L74 TaxID=3369422 RepID=UPI003F5E7283
MPDKTQLITPEQLCVGLYIHLDLAWWEHGFTFSKFKIKDEAHIAALHKLGLKQVRYDPSRSDCEPLQLQPEAPQTATPAGPGPASVEEQARQERVAKLGVLRKRLAEVERKFVQTSQMVKQLNQALRNSPEDVVKQTGAVVNELVAAIMTEDGVVLHSINGKAAEDAYFHSLNVAVLSMLLGRQLGYDSEACHTLGMGGLLHDMGKLDVPSQVLLKTTPLNRAELQFLQLHTEFGLKRGQKLMLDDEVLRIIHEHHEHCDGTGYPRKLVES